MSETVNEETKADVLVSDTNHTADVPPPHDNHPPNNAKPALYTNSVPYLERIRQYYNRRLPARSHSKPVMDAEPIPKPPKGKPETEEGDDDDRETVNKPYPGVDDGFFHNTTNNNNNPDVEDIPLMPKDPGGRDEPPEGDEGNNPNPGVDEPDIGGHFPGSPHWPGFPEKPGSFPGIRPDVEGGYPMEPLPDINVYQHKKTLAQGMMDLALFSANANQLRYVLESYDRHPYYYTSLVLISLSLILQVAVGIGLIWNAYYNVKDEKEICIANRANNITMIGIFLITVLNVFISAFGVANVS